MAKLSRKRFNAIGSKLLGLGLLCLVILAGLSCSQFAPGDELGIIKARGELRVLTRNNATCYYEGPHGLAGFEYDLVKAFADHLGVKLACVVTDNFHDMIPSLLRGDADLIAAGFTITERRMRKVAFGPAYMEVQQQVVGRRGGPAPGEVADLIGQPLWINAGTSYEERLRELKENYPDLSWLPVSGYETEEILEMVWQGIIPLTIADSNIVAVNRRYYPQLVIHFPIEEGQQLAWAMHPQHRHLLTAVENWFYRPETTALLQRLKHHYYGHLEIFDYVDLVKYHSRLQRRLPKYRDHFKSAAAKYNLDWRLVAAQAYQESHWDPKAASFTGVRGIMMLTQKTAKDLGIESRIDPLQSIEGGVRYLAKMHELVGDEVPEPDRTYMALAAYNVGWGHLEDARTLAERLDKNPKRWQDVRDILPLLRQKRYYRTLPHGYARGTEPVRYVDRIKTYYRILVQATEETPSRPSELAEVTKTFRLNSQAASM
ncbi:MAG: membrane-bound lytic murein transglycosylase MltF [Syntrophobacterales bacterium]|jgi:membrane-bound lytic murein transglycosylase F